MSERCNCPNIDGFRLIRQGCPHHVKAARPMPEPVVAAPDERDEAIEAACAWSDYRSDYGASGAQQHKAFLAGWKAAREGDQSGVLR